MVTTCFGKTFAINCICALTLKSFITRDWWALERTGNPFLLVRNTLVFKIAHFTGSPSHLSMTSLEGRSAGISRALNIKEMDKSMILDDDCLHGNHIIFYKPKKSEKDRLLLGKVCHIWSDPSNRHLQ